MEDQNIFVKVIVYFVTGVIFFNIAMYVIGLVITLVKSIVGYIKEKRREKLMKKLFQKELSRILKENA